MPTSTRQRVLDEFRKNPYRSLKEIAQVIGITPSSVSLYLCALEADRVIVRPKIVRDTSRQASTPGEASREWAISHNKGAIGRGEGAMHPRRARGEDSLQKRIAAVIAKAEVNGTCFRAEYVKLVKLGGCKCG